MKTSAGKFLPALILLALVVLAVIYRQPLMSLLSDLPRLRAWLQDLGPWGPVALICLNAAQIVAAPLPGQLVQTMAGYLFGLWPGAIYGGLGMALGGTLSMSLGRLYGRPLVARMVGAERLSRWERVARTDSPFIWLVLMLPPFGDIPYLLAGLTRVPMWKVLAIMTVVRWPSAIVHAAVGAGVVARSPYLLGGLLGGLTLLGVLGLLYGARLQDWFEEHVLNRLPGERDSSAESKDG